ncbi:acetyl/propionyl-CoA carboxylase subunit alpha [Nocardioides szechwanensis]|uniref:Propionyl-CoA carboxylase alpha chain n=1 Tax=Nocardioides szechwanensis TaxID=1005944 RepID=A0A1H0E672_9ACTN|nr:biotin carboxylase N-terminal domain-containing protein [Nocardioides szechwanensis]GEP34764.1 acetyl/propionyl-CoA carboxylase subunit alpha [Nocardioides szechwanensis]SDN77845.1 propionyl-CoA carboxylase alpha chain [Nocardioides szechwanensis]
MISRILVANRAEIASRVFRTCRTLGIETVAVHSDADADLPYVREADHAVRLPGTAPADTYLRADLILDAARRAGADAIHPGYGFLSENAEFARAVEAAGLTWIGPAPSSIEQMGSKIESKKLMEAAGVPVLTNIDVASATDADLPLIVKASAGGGGRGMRIVRTLADLPGEVDKARAEAESAFGDGTVFVEPYVEHGRHVEVQVLGHRDGVEVFGERDCSIQRRHQKVVEEAPAPLLLELTRRALHDAARAAAAAIDYRGAGTVEFLYDAERDRFFFLEMNTRLQVEHPVTEEVFGVDLVALQIAVAEGRVPESAGDPRGHAIEVRLYAEDPGADYQPQSGRLTTFEIPREPGVRIESGFVTGSEVSTHYDAMLAKVIVHAATREEAARRLRGVLRRSRLHGLVTNRDLLVEVLGYREFLSGEVSTAFLSEAELGSLEGSSVPGTAAQQAVSLFASAMAWVEQAVASRSVQRAIPAGWRNVHSAPQVITFDLAGTELRVGWRQTGASIELVDLYDEVHGVRQVSVEAAPLGWRVVVDHEGVSTTHEVRIVGQRVDVDSPWGHLALTSVPRFVDPADQVASGSLLAPMPGTVVRVAVEAGAQVAAGDPVLVLEAMKMQHTVSAPHAGTVTQVNVHPGTQVAAGEVLAVVETGEDA